MTLLSSCGCAPSASSRLIADAARRLDPTGTENIRARMSSDLARRWSRLRVTIRDALTTHDLLGLGAPTAASVVRSVGDPVKTFQAFVDEALGRIVLGGDGEWMAPYLQEAASRGRARAARLAGWQGASPRARTDRVVLTGAIVELQGAMEVVSQRVVRAAANGLLRRAKARDMVTEAGGVVVKVGVVRGRALVSFVVVRAYNEAVLDALEDLGVRRVGVEAEHVRKPRVTTDAGEDENLVEVLTAGDDDVCEECEDISTSGPYDIDEARGLIPAHPRCRCAFVPFGDERFAAVERE